MEAVAASADHSALHARAREKGVNPLVYWLVRALLQPFFHLYFRLSRIGREHVPESGPVIFAANHRSFLDPFMIATLTPRPLYYVAKEELFRNPLLAWLLNSLGAFPVRRGTGDADMIDTAKEILGRGDAVLIFPEGTRSRTGKLLPFKRGGFIMALKGQAPVVPVAITGARDAMRKGSYVIQPVTVTVRFGKPVETAGLGMDQRDVLAAAVRARIEQLLEEG